MTRDEMLPVLAACLPDGHRLTAITPLATGFSNETYRLEGMDQILRLPPSAGAMLDGHDVLDQARIYRALGTVFAGPRVPEITYIGEDASLIGVPFFAMAEMPGEALHDLDMQAWFTDVAMEERTAMCRGWIEAFAGLARLAPLTALGEPVAAADYVQRWRSFAAGAGADALVTMFDRLLAFPAPLSGEPAVIHGDPKMSNLMWHDGRIVAMLDWEMALNGEPLSDLGYLLFFFASPFHGPTRAPALSGMLDRAGVIALWEEVAGRTAQGVEWHEIAQAGKICAILAQGLTMMARGATDDPKLEAFQRNLDAYQATMRAMLDAYEATQGETT